MTLADEFLRLMQSKGEAEPDEDVLGDAVAFAGVSKYPARIKCALLGWMAWKDATAQVDRSTAIGGAADDVTTQTTGGPVLEIAAGDRGPARGAPRRGGPRAGRERGRPRAWSTA